MLIVPKYNLISGCCFFRVGARYSVLKRMIPSAVHSRWHSWKSAPLWTSALLRERKVCDVPYGEAYWVHPILIRWSKLPKLWKQSLLPNRWHPIWEFVRHSFVAWLSIFVRCYLPYCWSIREIGHTWSLLIVWGLNYLPEWFSLQCFSCLDSKCYLLLTGDKSKKEEGYGGTNM